MSEYFRFSGKKVPVPSPSPNRWKFELRPGGWMIATNDAGLRRRFIYCENRGKVSASLGGYLWTGERIQSTSSAQGATRGSDSDLTAQFPGKIRKILVTHGSEVSEGDPLVLVEAMKMEFSIRAPYSGTVKRVLVKDGQQISPGDQFVELEARESEKNGN